MAYFIQNGLKWYFKCTLLILKVHQQIKLYEIGLTIKQVTVSFAVDQHQQQVDKKYRARNFQVVRIKKIIKQHNIDGGSSINKNKGVKRLMIRKNPQAITMPYIVSKKNPVFKSISCTSLAFRVLIITGGRYFK
jgi:hypothetical protein